MLQSIPFEQRDEVRCGISFQPGQRQCFFNVPAGAASYEIKTPATVNVYHYGETGSPPKTYLAKGSWYVDPCKENTFIIQ